LTAIVRPLFALLTFLTVLLALVTLLGRGGMLVLDRFEPQINRGLDRFGLEVGGLSGSWHRLNPVVRLDSLRFDGGSVRDLELEVDLLRSAFRSGPVIRVMRVDRVDVALTRTPDGNWQVGSSAAETPSDPQRLLDWLDHFWRTTGTLDLPDIRLRFVEQVRDGSRVQVDEVGSLPLSVQLRRERGRLDGRLRVGSLTADCPDCQIELGYRIDQRWGGWLESGQVWLQSPEYRLPEELGALFALGEMQIDGIDGYWVLRDASLAGQLAVDAGPLQWRQGRLDAAALQLSSRYDRNTGVLRMLFDQLQLTADAEHFEPALLQLELETDASPVLQIRAAELDAGSAIAVVRNLFANVETARVWLDSLAPAGRIDLAQANLDLAALQLGYEAELSDVSLENYKGSPMVRDLRTRVRGTEQLVDVYLGQEDLTLGFLEIYDEPTLFDRAAGRLLFYISPSYFALRGHNLALDLADTRARGSFGLSRPTHDAGSQVLYLDIEAENVPTDRALPLVPNRLPAGLLDWLNTGIRGGHVDHARVAIHTHLDEEWHDWRQVAVQLDIRSGELAFHEDWPVAEDLTGRVVVDNSGTKARLARGRISGVQLDAAQLFVPIDADHLALSGVGSAGGQQVLSFIHNSPLADWLPGVDASWQADGDLDLDLRLHVPLIADIEDLEVELAVDLLGLDLDMADLNLALAALRGPVEYRYPFDVQAEAVSGVLLNEPVQIRANGNGGQINFDFIGATEYENFRVWLGLPEGLPADGRIDYDARLTLNATNGVAPALRVRSELTDLALDIPGGLDKPVGTAWPTEVNATWLGSYLSLGVDVMALGEAWLLLDGAGVRQGAISFGEPLVPHSADAGVLAFSGYLPAFDLAKLPWDQPTDGPPEAPADLLAGLPMPEVVFDGLHFGELRFDQTVLRDVALDGRLTQDAAELVVVATDLAGSLRIAGDGAPWDLHIEHLHLPELAQNGTADALNERLGQLDRRALPPLDVRLDALLIGDENWGRWNFNVRHDGDILRIGSVDAELKGLRIESEEGLFWYDDGATSIVADLSADDLGTVLTQFGYAPSVESRRFDMHVDLYWPDAPWSVSLEQLRGRVSVGMRDGRFVDVQTGAGAQRILSLLNLAKIARRITMDFSDVFGRGISFDRLDAQVQLLDGRMQFLQPMVIDGTGSAFRINGEIDLIEGTLNNDMIVTLPVGESLPWYAAYLAVANPLAAGAILVGERLFRAQIEQMSSARYRVEGTVDDPRVSFQRAFPTAMEAIAPEVELGTRGHRLDREVIAGLEAGLPAPPEMVLVPIEEEATEESGQRLELVPGNEQQSRQGPEDGSD
jgi:uncharacterized protein (TIGR02099 family)